MSAPAAATAELRERIDHALAVADRILGDVGPLDLDRPTPCPGWDLRALLAHLVGGVAEMAGLVVAAAAPASLPAGAVAAVPLDPANPLTAWPAAVAADRVAWAEPSVHDGVVAFSFGSVPAPMAAMIHLTELTVHAIDVAVAIGRTDLVDEALAAGLLRSMHELGGIDGFRIPGMFGAEVAVAADAPAHVRLLGYVGRQV